MHILDEGIDFFLGENPCFGNQTRTVFCAMFPSRELPL
jgi:hypothetical protein